MKFNTVKLGDYLYIKGRIGWKGLKKSEYLSESAYRIINGESLTDNGIDWSKAGYISKERYEESPEIMLQDDDILLSKDGTIGKIGFVKHLDKPTSVASGIFVIRNLKPEVINTRFIYNYLTSSAFKNFVIMRTEGSVIPHLYQKDFIELDFPFPSINIQEKIVAIIDGISNKIELNNQINKNLEQQAQAIYKAWFVDFEPFGGIMPDEWSHNTLGEVTEMSAGGDKPKNSTDSPTEKNNIPIYSNGISDEGLYGFTDHAKIVDESVTVSARGTIGYVCLRQSPYVPIVRLITIVPKTHIVSAKYIYLCLKTMNISGTGTTQQQLTVPNFKGTEILVPDVDTMKQFTLLVNPMFKKIYKNKNENQRLSEIRDTLLPKLMNGEIDVSEVKI